MNHIMAVNHTIVYHNMLVGYVRLSVHVSNLGIVSFSYFVWGLIDVMSWVEDMVVMLWKVLARGLLQKWKVWRTGFRLTIYDDNIWRRKKTKNQMSIYQHIFYMKWIWLNTFLRLDASNSMPEMLTWSFNFVRFSLNYPNFLRNSSKAVLGNSGSLCNFSLSKPTITFTDHYR